MEKALLDTNFYINLIDEKCPLHDSAREYFKYFLDEKITMFLSTIVVGEFCVKGSFQTLPIKSSRILSYNLPHSNVAARFAAVLFDNNQLRGIPGGRKIISNDVKLLAQTTVESIDFFVTSDGPCKSLITTLANNGLLNFRYVDFSKPVGHYFPRVTNFHLRGQASIFDILDTPLSQ